MLKLFVAVCLVVFVATLVSGQAPDEECRQRPTADPRACCNITKTFDRTEFPECFTEEVANGAGGNRGSNRQRRAAHGPWSGHGGYWEHHDHDRFHHGPPGFHAPSSYNGPRDGAIGFRRDDDREANFGSNDRTNGAGVRGSEQGSYFNYRGSNVYENIRGERRTFNDGGVSNRGFAAEGNMVAFSCQIECFLTKSRIMTNNVIDARIANDRLVAIFPTVPGETLGPAVQKCAEKINTFKATGKPEIPPQLRDIAGKCPHAGGMFLMCIHHEIFLNCPSNTWTPTNECNALKDFIEKCRPARRADGPPGRPSS